jgi:hypothetical protein
MSPIAAAEARFNGLDQFFRPFRCQRPTVEVTERQEPQLRRLIGGASAG